MLYPHHTKRLKCIIFIFNTNISKNFHDFLKFAWSHQFLDITVIELLQQNHITYSKLNSSNTFTDAIVYQYNPFNDTYARERFFPRIQLFSDKLRDLYGCTLYTGFYEWAPMIYASKKNRSKFSESVFGVESLMTQAVAKFMNFTIGIKVYAGNPKDVWHGIEQGNIDFSASSFMITGIPSMYDKMNTTWAVLQTSTFLYSMPTQVMVKQYPKYTTGMANGSILISCFFLLSQCYLLLLLGC